MVVRRIKIWRRRRVYLGRCPKMAFQSLVTHSRFPFDLPFGHHAGDAAGGEDIFFRLSHGFLFFGVIMVIAKNVQQKTGLVQRQDENSRSEKSS